MSKKQTTEAPAAEWVRVKIKKTTHVAGAIAAPGAIVNVSKETADRLVTDGMGVILY
ncbi:MAG: hypothetical protein IJA81_00190 [Akkermansia sp.]|nr:hypothetical protein [Akkermansia sp.]